MKPILFSTILLGSLSRLAAQTIAPVGMQAEFNQLSKFTSQRTGFESLQTYSSGIVNGSQFFAPNWCTGTIITGQNERPNCSGYLFLFDKVRQELFLHHQDSSVVLLAEKDKLRSFTLFTDKPHIFVKASVYDPAKKDIFFEVLTAKDSGYTLLKQIITHFMKADPHDMQKIKAGENYDEFKDEVSYYLSYRGGLPQKLPTRKAAISKLFPLSQKQQLEAFFLQQPDADMDEGFLVKMVDWMNQYYR